jgi:carbon monoxide dehydrogenase subunit G
MTKFESKVGQINANSENIYNFLSDFTHFENFIPKDKVKDWSCNSDSCSFTVDMAGKVILKMVEKQPFSLVKIGGDAAMSKDFNFWIQLKEVAPNDTRIKLTLGINVNPVMKMMVSKPLQNFVDTLVDQLEKLTY